MKNCQLRRDKGFSLVELAFVLVIISVLIAIAVPTFLGITNNSKDKRTQGNLKNVISAARAGIYAENGSYPASSEAIIEALESIEPNFSYSETESGNDRQIRVQVTGAGVLTLAARADTGKCYYVEDDPEAGILGPVEDPSESRC